MQTAPFTGGMPIPTGVFAVDRENALVVAEHAASLDWVDSPRGNVRQVNIGLNLLAGERNHSVMAADSGD
jgi:hypothetical protein